MKLKFTVLFIFYALFSISANSQSYNTGDIDALVTLKESSGQEYFLNWYHAPLQYWEGVTWWFDTEAQMYRVTELNLANKNISGNLVVKGLSHLSSLQCQNNMLKGLTIENCPSLNSLNCAVNQLPISELLKYTYLSNNFVYGPQYAIFDEFTSKTGYVIDYSSQADGGNTKFVFRNRSKPGNDGSEIVAVNNTGICPTIEDGVYFCEMVNAKLPYFYSHTANVNILSSPTISFTIEEGNIGKDFSFSIAAKSIDTPLFFDFGDGVLVEKKVDYKTEWVQFTIQNTSSIKIYGFNIWYFDINSYNDVKINSLDVTQCRSLEVLNCRNNKLSLLNLEANTNLKGLYCSQNKLPTLNISTNSNLEYLNCDRNNLTKLEIRKNPNLKSLNCSENNLVIIDVSRNSNLDHLDVSYNLLTNIDISYNTKLSSLYCNSNYLTSLDVSNNTELYHLVFRDNNITSINLSNNPHLRDFDCQNNRLTKLDISNNRYINFFYCKGNNLPISELLPINDNLTTRTSFSDYMQNAVFEKNSYSSNVTINYSSEADGGNTTFVFRNRSKPGTDGSEIVAVNNTGLYTTQGNGVYFCEMVNPKLNPKWFYSYTQNTTVNLSGNSSLKSMSLADPLSSPSSEEKSELVKIYPNPVVNVINIELPSENATITLYSIDGKQLKKVEATSAKSTISMEDLEKGNYIIEIETAKEKIKRKIVKL